MRHARPHPDTASVHMHEGRTGGRIESDAAALHPKADLAQLFEPDSRNVEVERMAEHVLAETRDAAAAPPQHGIGLRRSITADHFNRIFCAGFALNVPNQIDE